jgi:hypothetical protein
MAVSFQQEIDNLETINKSNINLLNEKIMKRLLEFSPFDFKSYLEKYETFNIKLPKDKQPIITIYVNDGNSDNVQSLYEVRITDLYFNTKDWYYKCVQTVSDTEDMEAEDCEYLSNVNFEKDLSFEELYLIAESLISI